MKHALLRMRAYALSALLGMASGCTMVTDASSYEEDATAFARDLDYTFDFRSPGSDGKPVGAPVHLNAPLDVAVVNQDNFLRARARIVLPVSDAESYVPERLVMENALLPGETYRLLFFVDSVPVDSESGEVGDYRVQQNNEHVWIEEPAANGTGSFLHSTNFRFFKETDYRSNTDLALALPTEEQLVGLPTLRQICLKQALGRTFELRVRTADQRVVGLFRHYPATTRPASEIRLNGIIDASATYRLEVELDGELHLSEFTAADEATLAVNGRTTALPFNKWFPDCK